MKKIKNDALQKIIERVKQAVREQEERVKIKKEQEEEWKEEQGYSR